MFYVKEKVNDALEIFVEINDNNVFCHCPICGCEVAVDLVDILGDGESNLFGTAVFCDDCGKKFRSAHGRNEYGN